MSLQNPEQAVAWLALLGAAVGLGQLLSTKEELTVRLVVGRGVMSAGLGVASASILAFIPGLPITAQLGLAALMASLGTSSLEYLWQKAVDKWFPSSN